MKLSTPAVRPPAVQVLRVDMAYPDGVTALRQFDLTVGDGEFVTVIGPSGCGKSTLLKLVAGLLQPTAGEVLLWGQPPQRQPPDGHRTAFVFQSPSLMPWSSVRANVRLPLDLSGAPKGESDARVAAALALVGLADFANAMPGTLSAGMRMRVSIARSFVVKPHLLLMDEPFGALDEITRHRLDSELLQIWRSSGAAVLFVTHSIHEAVYLSGRVLVMAAGPGRVIDEVVIDEPWPRSPGFMVSERFTAHARRLQERLLHASLAEAG